jgi:transcriptional regulator with XRE-family HTH domain
MEGLAEMASQASGLAIDTTQSIATVVEALAKRRKRLGLSQRDLAERMGVVQSTVAKLEGRTQEPTLSLLDRCSQALGLRLFIGLMETDKSEPAFPTRAEQDAGTPAEKTRHARAKPTGKGKRDAA